MEEIWRDIEINGYEGMYQISSMGRVKSLSRITKKKGFLFKKEQIRRLHLKKSDGYVYVVLCNNAKKKTIAIHVLMALFFIDKDYVKKGLVVNHKDRIKNNNKLPNIEIVTASENAKHRWRNPEAPRTIKKVLNKKDVLMIRSMYSTGLFSYNMMSEMLGLSRSTIRCIIKRVTWKHI